VIKRLILLGLAISGTVEAFRLAHDATKPAEPKQSFAGKLLHGQNALGFAAVDDDTVRYGGGGGCGCGG
jgi:hypothetical protein